MELRDGMGRRINYLRLSVTDRCNLRCVYCMPEEGFELCKHEDVLTLEEFADASEKFVRLFGIDKIRITGGEPLVKRNIEFLIEKIAKIPGLKDLGLTTNGVLLAEKGRRVYDAGIRRINISLDTLNPERFNKITRFGKLEESLEGIETAKRIGFSPVKINVVLLPGFDEEIEFIEWANENGFVLRFIEWMEGLPTGYDLNNGRIPHMQDVIDRITSKYGTVERVPDTESTDGHHTVEYEVPSKNLRFEFIPAMSNHFCMACNRLRLNCEGNLRYCLFSDHVLAIRELLKKPEEEFINAIQTFVKEKAASRHDPSIKSYMFSIGG